MPNKLNQEDFIRRVKEVHGDTYDLSPTVYVKAAVKVLVGCYSHGTFPIQPFSLLGGRGCRKCGIIRAANKNSINHALSKEQFIDKSKTIHGDAYDYSRVIYKNNSTEVELICPIHKSFFIKPAYHLCGSICPKCCKSKSIGEFRISEWLKSKGIEFETEKTFNNCVYRAKLRFDFYIREKNLVIEYDGIQHFYPTFGEESFFLTTTTDAIKSSYVKDNNINMLRIPYTDLNIISDILEKALL